MKQMKFLLVALMAVVMSVSVTSCMNGENNPVYTGLAVAECVIVHILLLSQSQTIRN